MFSLNLIQSKGSISLVLGLNHRKTKEETITLKCEQGNSQDIAFLIREPLAGLAVKASAARVEDLGFERWDFYGSSHISDFKIGNPVTTLPGAWHHRVSAGTSRPGVNIL